MEINVNLTHDEYITLLVAVRDQQQEYRENIPCSIEYQEYWKKAYKTTTSLLNKLYATAGPT